MTADRKLAEIQAQLDKINGELAVLEAEFERTPEGGAAYDEYVADWPGSSAYERAFEAWAEANDKWGAA